MKSSIRKVESFENIVQLSYSETKKIDSLDKALFLEKKYLKGKSSYLWSFLSELKENSEKSKKIEKGTKINTWKNKISELIRISKKKFTNLNDKEKTKNHSKKSSFLSEEKSKVGSLHLLKSSLSKIYSFFVSRGYEVFESKEIETKWYNFDSLNLERDHPARSWSDTFYFSKNPNFLLRTHTSNSQVRIMEKNSNSEIMIISGGKVYRNDDEDLTHSHQYTNIEIIRVGKKVSFANLKWILEDFFRWFFERELVTRFRPSFFPFTEPSFEVDICCFSCNGKLKKCKICKGTRWIEVLGAGLINSSVLRNGLYNEKKFCGFAAGIGLERILMIKHQITDIRDFYLNDPRFLIQTNWS